MLVIHRQRLIAYGQQSNSKNMSMGWQVVTDMNQRRGKNKRDKASDTSGVVSKPKTLFKKDIKNKAYKTTQDRCVEDDVVEKTGLMKDAATLFVGRKEVSSVSIKCSQGPKASGDKRKTSLSNAETLKKLEVARVGRSALPQGDDSTEKVMESKDGEAKMSRVMDGLSTPK